MKKYASARKHELFVLGKNTIYTILIIALLLSCVRTKPITNHKMISISGKVQQQFLYCGGAAPTQAILDSLRNPKPYPNKRFYIRKGNINVADAKVIESFTTSKGGLFSVELPIGTYSILVEEQLAEINPKDYMTTKQKVDEQCLIEWWKKPYYLLEIKDQNTISLNFIFIHRCFLNNDIPCISYSGPMPHKSKENEK